MEINGIAHIFITAGDFDASRAFYSKLLPFLGLKVVADAPGIYYCVGGRTGFGIEAPPQTSRGKRFVQGDVGLHHICFRARERGDVDEAHRFLVEIGAHIVHAPQADNYAPGYYSVLFEDPDGTRLEINHVPGRGLLQEGTKIGGVYSQGLPP
jgi:catechol 2,3-dioxygenase-like lactoylglutathione lyase family enzyme